MAGNNGNNGKDAPKKRRKYGKRPTKLTEAVISKLERGLSTGMPWKMASSFAGVSYTTVREWILKAEAGKLSRKWADLPDRLTRASQVACQKAVVSWANQFDTDWRACRDFLARRDPEGFPSRQQLEVSGKDGGPIALNSITTGLEKLPDEYLEKIQALMVEGMAKATGHGGGNGSNGDK